MFYEPPKAKEATLDDLLRKYPDHTVVEPKLDGVRAIIHIWNGVVKIQSRHVGVDGEYGRFEAKVPHISQSPYLRHYKYSGYCVLDGELISPSASDTLGHTMSILGSSAEVAIQKQKDSGELLFYAFDMPFWNGHDLRHFRWESRNKELRMRWGYENSITVLSSQNIYSPAERIITIEEMIDKGLEGVVVKHPLSSYGTKDAWLKIKRQISIDAQVTGYTMGKGKYEGTLGSMKVSVYDTNGQLQEIGSVSPGDDRQRPSMFGILSHLTSQEIRDARIIIEVTAQQWTSHNKLRHPRIVRYLPGRQFPNTVSDNVVQ